MISVVVMAHPKRKEWAEGIAKELDCRIVWDEKNSMWDTGRRALLAYHPKASHHLVIQDDTIPSEGLLSILPELARPGPVSLYAGNNSTAQRGHKLAQLNQTPWWRYLGLVWGPAVIHPVEHLEPLVEFGDRTRIRSYDQRLTAYWRRKNVACWYTSPSLVNHRMGDNESLIGGRDKREAYLFGTGVGIDWSLEPVTLSRDVLYPPVVVTDGRQKRKVRYGTSIYKRLMKRPGWDLDEESRLKVELRGGVIA